MKFYKILNEEEYHYGLQYHDGLNEDILDFYPKGSCKAGGMYYSGKDIFSFLPYGPWIREVVLLEDSKIYKDQGEDSNEDPEKWKTNKFFLKPRRRIDENLINELIKEGANIYASNGYVFNWASSKGYLSIVKLLLEAYAKDNANANINALCKISLKEASYSGRLEVVKLLLGAGADVHIFDDAALRFASFNGHLEVVNLLLENGADIHALKDRSLRWACSSNKLEVVNLLLKNGADIHAIDDEALRCSSDSNHLEVVKLLLKKGANAHALNGEALRKASANGHLEMLKILRQAM